MQAKKKYALRHTSFYYISNYKLLECLCGGDCNCNGHTDHGVVACAQEAHHLNVSGDGGGTCELSVTMHTAHGVGHAVGSGACSHVVGVQGTAGATAGSRKT